MELQPLIVKREGEFSYPVWFARSDDGLVRALDEAGLSGRFLCLVTDSNVEPLYLERIREQLKAVCTKTVCFVFPAGEENKTLKVVQDLYTFLIREGMDRKGVLAALGGGVTGDLTGFTAATYLRGIDFIQLPTTLLAQVDSSVGGKTGVDFDRYKNMVGAFHQPGLVYMDFAMLKTLPVEQFSCGMGEVLKTGLICDGAFFREICARAGEIRAMDPAALQWMVRRCVEIKAEIVERDPTEKGDRALLNLGHTIGHAVEKLKNFRLLHGQCVAIGLMAAARISMRRGLMNEAGLEEIQRALKLFDLPCHVDGLDPMEVLSATRKDKKMVQGRIRFILMRGIGEAFADMTVTDEELLEGIRFVCRP